MKNSLKHLGLWQKKREELKINDDAAKDWLEMNTLLNQHMPATKPSSWHHKVLSHVKGLKALSLTAASLSAAAMVYVGVHMAYNKTHKQHQQKHHQHEKLWHQKDSIVDRDSSVNNSDSILNQNSTTDSLNQAIHTNIDSQQQKLLQDKNVLSPNDSIAANNTTASTTNNTSITLNPHNSHTPGITGKTGNHKAAIASSVYTGAFGKQKHAANGFSHSSITQAHTGRQKILQSNSSSQFTNRTAKVYATTKNAHSHKARKPTDESMANNYQDRSTRSASGQDNNATNEILPNIISGSQQQSPNVTATQTQSASSNSATEKAKAEATATDKNKKDHTKLAAKQSQKDKKEKKTKNTKSKNQTPFNFDWGLLVGVNSSGSFTAKAQNKNIYGSSPIDTYLGLYATYHLNDTWAVNMQVRALSPQKINGSYSHANGSSVDSGQLIQVTDSRKAYFVSVPVHAVYKLNSNLSIKAGPVINIPVKQISGSTSLSPSSIIKDSSYYATTTSQLSATKYSQKPNFGVSGGISYQYKRLLLEATYQKSLSGYNVTSSYGSYKATNGTLQFTVGFQLNRPKP